MYCICIAVRYKDIPDIYNSGILAFNNCLLAERVILFWVWSQNHLATALSNLQVKDLGKTIFNNTCQLIN